jgi:hypothetical protein
LTAKQKIHLLRSASSFVIAAYVQYASFLKTRAPCIWSFFASPFISLLLTKTSNPSMSSATGPFRLILIVRAGQNAGRTGHRLLLHHSGNSTPATAAFSDGTLYTHSTSPYSHTAHRCSYILLSFLLYDIP